MNFHLHFFMLKGDQEGVFPLSSNFHYGYGWATSKYQGGKGTGWVLGYQNDEAGMHYTSVFC